MLQSTLLVLDLGSDLDLDSVWCCVCCSVAEAMIHFHCCELELVRILGLLSFPHCSVLALDLVLDPALGSVLDPAFDLDPVLHYYFDSMQPSLAERY